MDKEQEMLPAAASFKSLVEMERHVGMCGGPLSLETERTRFPGKAGMVWAEDTCDKPVCCLSFVFGLDRMFVIYVSFLFSLYFLEEECDLMEVISRIHYLLGKFIVRSRKN